jgi:ABC-type bacteriocin/lantibiotic exporter with double-glycine peptidase domain
MHYFLYWGDHLNWLPIVWLGVASLAVFLTRMLTVWLFLRQLVVPALVSSLYFLTGIALILTALWGLIATAWWMLPLGCLCWFVVHRPGRDAMEAWASFQRSLETIQDADALLKSDLTPQQQKAIKKRLGLS